MGFNFIAIEGNLANDPVLTSENDGMTCTFDVENNGNFQVITNGMLAEICAKYLKKGMRVLVSGRGDARGWIIGREVNFLSPKQV